jgi:adenosylmethionine-8-amino-7-oxononanoate aminotransferase
MPPLVFTDEQLETTAQVLIEAIQSVTGDKIVE